MKNSTVVSSPPRCGNNFLNFMLNRYIETNRLDYDRSIFGRHDPDRLLGDRYDKSLTVIRKPKDAFLSVLVFTYEEDQFEDIEGRFLRFKNNYMKFLKNLKNGDKAYYILFEDLTSDINNIIYKIFNSLDSNCPKSMLDPDAFKDGTHPLKDNKYKSPMPSKDSNKELRNELLIKIKDISFNEIEEEISKLLSEYPEKRIQ